MELAEAYRELRETFKMHHKVTQGYQELDKISKYEFIEYYMHVSFLIQSDSQFSLLIESVWGLDDKDNLEI